MKLQKKIPVELLRRKITRQIDVVQGDTGIQLLFEMMDFKIPDGTSATIYVQKPSGKFVYQEEDITVSSDVVTVDLHNQAIVEHGKCPYQVQLTNGSDTITTFAGFICVEKKYSDSGAEESKTVIVAFEEKTAEQIAKIEAAAQEQIEQIQNLYNTYATKTEAANAVKGNLSGAVVAAADVSPLEHNPDVIVRGKNYFDVSKIPSISTATNNGDGSITIAANTYYCRLSKTLREVCPQLKAGKVVVLSFKTGSSAIQYMYFHGLQGTWNVGHHITMTDEILDSYVTVYGYPENDTKYGQENVISDIQIEDGTVVTDYEPYIDPSTVTVTRCGKNILDLSKMCNSFFVENADGSYSFTMGEIAGERFSKKIPFSIPAGIPFCFSTEIVGHTVTNETLYMILSHADGTASYPGIGFGEETRTITFDKAVTHIQFYLQSSEVAGAYIKFRNFQIEKGNSATVFEPYNGAEYTPDADGTVSGITSLSPNMTILTDTEGVIVECEYNIDLMKFLENHSGGLDLAKLTVEVKAVEGGNQLSLSDGTTTKTVLIPTAAVKAEDVQAAVDNYLAENPVQNGKDGANGKDGQDGADGADGLTPYIGENGNWWIGDTDTGVAAGGSGGGASGFRLINTIEISEAVTQILFDTDSDGNPFELEEYFLVFDNSPCQSAEVNNYIRHNGSAGTQWTRYAIVPLQANTTTNTKPWVWGKCFGGVLNGLCNYNKNTFVQLIPIDFTTKITSILVHGGEYLSGRVRLFGK